MARRGLLDGQLHMFDFYKDIRQPEGEQEVEMVSLMPPHVEEEEPEKKVTPREETERKEKHVFKEVNVQPKTPVSKDIVMHKEKVDAKGTVIAEISYLNYNKVYLQREGEAGNTRCFENSKEAVDYYLDEMLKL